MQRYYFVVPVGTVARHTAGAGHRAARAATSPSCGHRYHRAQKAPAGASTAIPRPKHRTAITNQRRPATHAHQPAIG